MNETSTEEKNLCLNEKYIKFEEEEETLHVYCNLNGAERER